MNLKKRETLFKIILVLFPFIILVFIEISLRLTGYGDNSMLFFKPKYIPDIYLENVAGYNKYQEKQNRISADKIENHIRNVMLVSKNPESIRGFIVGGSAAQGYPYNSNQSFSKMIEAALNQTGKFNDVEIMNLGVSAISSYSVRDISKKALKYEPDFLIVYAGNNEYYGTFSHVTGGNHLTRTLYMSLYKLKLFQVVSDLISLFSPKSSADQNKIIMRDRLQEAYMPKEEKTDRLVATNYIKNIESIIKRYNKKDIPVIVVEPISNVIDMAPFKGEKDAEIANFLIDIEKLINKGSFETADSALNILKKNYANNANLNFLEAKLHTTKTGDINLDKYIKAKNNDIVPFRPREELTYKLKNFSKEKKDIYNNFYFIPLSNYISKLYGDSIFGNSIFIDHVHFNQQGHKILAEIISGELINVINLDEKDANIISDFFSESDTVSQSVYSMPMFRMYAHKVIQGLTSDLPFSEMLFPYEFGHNELSKAITDLGFDLAERILPLDKGESFRQTVFYYIEKENYYLAHQYFLADKFSFPGSYQRHLNLAKFYRMFEDFVEESEQAYIKAFLLSEKNPDLYFEIMDFFYENNLYAKAQEFQKKHGRPKR